MGAATNPPSSAPPTPVPAGLAGLLRAAAKSAGAAGVFSSVDLRSDRVVCPAIAPGAPAEYRLFLDDGPPRGLWVGFFTADRWLSHSLEADLLHTGDKLGQLIAEELVELGLDLGPKPRIDEPEHFRDDAKQFTFRSPVPVAASEFGTPKGADLAAKYLLAYEAALRNLGDVDTREK